MDEKIKTWPLRFPAKETLIWRRHCSIGQSCCSMTSKKFLESSSGMKFVYPRVRLANQNPGAFVSVSYTNQIALFPFVCCFCFVRAFSFQGHTKIALFFHVTLTIGIHSFSHGVGDLLFWEPGSSCIKRKKPATNARAYLPSL